MGMLFNTKATTKMLQIVNDAFDQDSWTQWFSLQSDGTRPVDYFNSASPEKRPLWQIAIKMKIFGGSGQDSAKDKRFQKWLKGLDKVNLGDVICSQIYQALNNGNCEEIYFVLIPSNTIAVAPLQPLIGNTQVITISTVEVDKVASYVRKYRERLAARRAARKKKG